MSNVFEHLDIEYEELNKLGIVEIAMVKGERGSSGDYENLSHLPKINGVIVTGNKTSEDYGIDVIDDYEELNNLPKINNVTLTGNKTSNDLSLASQASMQSAELRLTVVENKIATIADPTDEQVAEAVDAWLDEHPEATTTVEDGAITFPKFSEDVANLFIANDTDGGNIVSFDDGASGIPVKDLTVSIEAVQSGSGDPSPTNVRPISGWDEVNVNRIGKNWCNKNGDLVLGFWTSPGGVPSITANTSNIAFNYKIPIPKGEALTLSANTSINNFGYCTFQADGTYINRINNNNTSSVTIASTTFDRYALVWVNRNNTAFSSLDSAREWLLSAEVQFEYNTQRTGFVSDGQTYTIDLNGTRYGGTLDVTAGELTVTQRYVDLGTLSYAYSSSLGFYANMTDAIDPIAGGDLTAICSNYKRSNYPQGWENGCFTISNSNISTAKRLFINDSRYSDTASFKTAMSGVQLVYELATPQVVQLTAAQVTTLLGQNNIWADCGDVAVIYRADTKKYIDGTIVDVPLAMIASIETSATASKAYAVGEYFILNGNQFCKAKTAIASGATFTLNTNYTVTTIGAELKALQ